MQRRKFMGAVVAIAGAVATPAMAKVLPRDDAPALQARLDRGEVVDGETFNLRQSIYLRHPTCSVVRCQLDFAGRALRVDIKAGKSFSYNYIKYPAARSSRLQA